MVTQRCEPFEPAVLEQFRIVYEMCGSQKQLDEETVEQHRILLGAETCKQKTTEIGTKLLEFSFEEEEEFKHVLQNKSQFGEKLGAIMVELHTPRLRIDSKTGKEIDELENEFDVDDRLIAKYPSSTSRSKKVRKGGGINVSLLELASEDIEQIIEKSDVEVDRLKKA